MTEGILAGGSCGMAVHAALQVAARDRRPRGAGRRRAPRRRPLVPVEDLQRRLDDPARLPRAPRRRAPSATCCAPSTPPATIPPCVTVQPHQKVRDAIALLHEHRVSQLPVVSAHDRAVGRRLDRRARAAQARRSAAPTLLDAEIVDVMEAPFPAVSADDPVREAVELLAGERQALLVPTTGRPAGILTRADLLETLVS